MAAGRSWNGLSVPPGLADRYALAVGG